MEGKKISSAKIFINDTEIDRTIEKLNEIKQ